MLPDFALGSQVLYQVIVIDEAGQPVTNATVGLKVIGGMAGMEGEHDEDFSIQLLHQDAGVYQALDSVGPSDLVLTGIEISVRRNGQSWHFMISSDDLQPR